MVLLLLLLQLLLLSSSSSITAQTPANVMSSFVTKYPNEEWALEGGDPCLPAPWTWVQCSCDSQPRIISIVLTGKGITGNIPSELTKLPDLVELHLDGNSFSGPIPDFSGSPNLEILHLENNMLTGSLPSSLGDLPKLKELYVQNNRLSGAVPPNLLERNFIFNYAGNTDLRAESKGENTAIAAALLTIIIYCLLRFRRREPEPELRIENNISDEDTLSSNLSRLSTESDHRGSDTRAENLSTNFRRLSTQSSIRNFDTQTEKSYFPTVSTGPSVRNVGTQTEEVSSYFNAVSRELAHRFSLQELKVATCKFKRQIRAAGGYGIVYYGKLTDEREIAVKLLTDHSYRGDCGFLDEVALLSSIHHTNIITLLGYSQQNGKNILVHEFMHNGTLEEHIRGSSGYKTLSWLKRLEIAEDSAKAIEYLHVDCAPTILHKDLKPHNILLDKQMRAKVAVDGSHLSSTAKTTVGYFDPDYINTQQLTEKSNVFSFGVILLELISGRKAITVENFGSDYVHIAAWATPHIESGNISAIVDESLGKSFNIQSIRRIAKTAMMCVKPKGVKRPTISVVLKQIQEAIWIEKRESN